jgi:hypothetical protein
VIRISREKRPSVKKKTAPEHVDHTPDAVLSISITSFDKILAKLNLDYSRQVPTDLGNRVHPPSHSRIGARTVTKGCSLVMSNDEDASV